MLVVGLTGGVASGKSTVASLFASDGVPVIDTDLIARELVTPGQPALAEIAARFGPDALSTDGTLNRPWLRQRIFADEAARKVLESILHPRIRAEVQRRLEALRLQTPPPAYALVVIPLLVETGAYDALLDRVLVVDLPEDLQLQRLMTRDGVEEPLARAMLAAQASREARLARADDVINNRGAPDDLMEQVERLHRLYAGLAA
ncbi:dephospho-CoA kinase [Thiofaba sp. EF100]|uniref:dephospho-CoA kinase n=1 Tax=Thiofaba sp. EF100 TaxID=3121274 RepID=UPI003221870E